MRGLLLLLLVFGLAACAGGPPRRIFAPEASIQELRIGDDQRWTAQLRIRNYSTVPMTYASLDAEFDLGQTGPMKIAITPDLTVPAGAVDVLEVELTPNAAAREAVAGVLNGGAALRYKLHGEIRSSDPRGRYDVDFASALGAVPGLPNVLR